MWRGSERARKEILPTLTLHVVLPSVVLILFQLDTLESNSWKAFSERTKPHDWHVHMHLVYAYVCTKGGFFQIYSISGIQICLKHITNKRENIRVYLGVKTCEVFLCFLATGYYFPWLYCVEFSVASLYSLFYVTREFQFTPRMSRTFSRMQSIHFRFRIQNLLTREQVNPLGRSYFGLTHLRIKSKTNPLQKCSRFVITPEKSPLV